MKNLMGIMEGGSIPTMSNLEEALKSEEKVPFSLLVRYLRFLNEPRLCALFTCGDYRTISG